MTPKPILKWVGGKTQILGPVMAEFPSEMNNYREIFLGGGSVLLAMLAAVKAGHIRVQEKIYAYDVNEALIAVYKNIQMHPHELYDQLQKIIVPFHECSEGGVINRLPQTLDEALVSKENYYYWIRHQYNLSKSSTTLLGSAMFIFLNKTCFRGVYRVGPNGFNVPYGHYHNPEIMNKAHLDEISELIQDVVFECCDFAVSMSCIEPGDFVYLDPPYAPEKANSFVSYTEKGFPLDSHMKLFELLHKLTTAQWMMNNSDVKFVRDNFLHNRIISLLCKRSIHSKNPDAKAKEVLITNY